MNLYPFSMPDRTETVTEAETAGLTQGYVGRCEQGREARDGAGLQSVAREVGRKTRKTRLDGGETGETQHARKRQVAKLAKPCEGGFRKFRLLSGQVCQWSLSRYRGGEGVTSMYPAACLLCFRSDAQGSDLATLARRYARKAPNRSAYPRDVAPGWKPSAAPVVPSGGFWKKEESCRVSLLLSSIRVSTCPSTG